MTYQQLTLNNSIIVDGIQFGIRTDEGELCKRVSSRQFAVPVAEGGETFFWMVFKPLLQDISVRIGMNGIMSEQGWVFEAERLHQVDHQPGGDRGRFMVSRRRGNQELVDAYAEAGIAGRLAEIQLVWRFLQPEYRSRSHGYSYGSDDVLRGGGMRGDGTRGVFRSLESFSEPTRSYGSKGFEEAIVGTGGESEMNTVSVNRQTDESQPVISVTFELVAVGKTSMRVPNTRPAQQRTFVW